LDFKSRYLYACPNPRLAFPTSYVMFICSAELWWEVIVVVVRSDCCCGEKWLLLWWEVIAGFVDIGGNVDHHCSIFFHG
jgi:hypothetical protein